ncbi:MAG: hypothetical protein ACLFTP_10700 [Rhodosalinus sp.]|uniref:hypothetical protein n=1 Tax=Rhodosalinus sp. TaxID=2047741 RepID=UPI00397A5C9D
MIRPEVLAAVSRWREALAGLALAALGLWAALGSFGILAWLGWAAVAAGAALVFAGIQRGRFRGRQGGPGFVEVVEGRIAYFGPLDGGAVALSEIEELRFDPSGAPPVWVLVQQGRPPLSIPVNAAGADALFDIFATLPGLRTGHLLAELEKGGRSPVVIWEHPSRLARRPRLH